MTRYLVVPERTGATDTLLGRVRQIASDDSTAVFSLLVPTPERVGNREVAAHLAAVNALLLRTRFERERLPLERTEIGDSSPVLAIEDELRARRDAYDAVILATQPPRVARAFALDAHSRADRLPLPVVHICEGRDRPLAVPLVHRMRAALGTSLGRCTAPIAALFRIVAERPRLGVLILALPMLIYLALGLGLAFVVDRRFLLNDAVALVIFALLLGGLLFMEHVERRAARRQLVIAEALLNAKSDTEGDTELVRGDDRQKA